MNGMPRPRLIEHTMREKPAGNMTIEAVINSLSDGLYVCDQDRHIIFWSKIGAFGGARCFA
jgi:hypothetical protein